ncbi:MAG TPA: SGNH/GDSL hydrolase family protein [Dictyobacter sp.]|nr:SGNH/GDSL hydrolase family protein [Dictyobacter sp.]
MCKVFYWRVSVALSCTLMLFLSSVSTLFAQSHQVIGPKAYYLALGDSLAFGYQPDANFVHGYVNDFSANLKAHGGKDTGNLACPGETSVTMINGGCPYPLLRKYPYIGSQLNAALKYLSAHRGKVSPVTLDIGANDIIPAIDLKTCSIDTTAFNASLDTLDTNLRQTILPQLRSALTINGQLASDFFLMNYYNPYANQCPATESYVQTLNSHLAADLGSAQFGSMVDVFSAFDSGHSPNPHLCTFTWMCSAFHDIHAKNGGYSVIASAFEQVAGY